MSENNELKALSAEINELEKQYLTACSVVDTWLGTFTERDEESREEKERARSLMEETLEMRKTWLFGEIIARSTAFADFMEAEFEKMDREDEELKHSANEKDAEKCFVGTTEAAKQLDIPGSTLRGWFYLGRIEGKRINNKILVDVESVKRFVEYYEKPATTLLSPKEMAQMLNVTSMTILNWSKSGKFPSLKIGSRYYTSKADFEKFYKKYNEFCKKGITK